MVSNHIFYTYVNFFMRSIILYAYIGLDLPCCEAAIRDNIWMIYVELEVRTTSRGGTMEKALRAMSNGPLKVRPTLNGAASSKLSSFHIFAFKSRFRA